MRRRPLRSFPKNGAGSGWPGMSLAPVSGGARLTPTIIVNPPVFQNVSRWSVSDVEQVLQEHELGYCWNSGRLIESMGRDDRISGCLRSRTYALLGRSGARFSILPPDTDDSSAADDDPLCGTISAGWPRWASSADLHKILADGVMAGVGLGRIQWTRTAKAWTPQLKHWPVVAAMWREHERIWTVFTREFGVVEVQPGDPNWLIYQPSGDRTWMSGGVRALGLPYLMRTFNWRDWARFNERHGLPIIAIKEPSGADDYADKDAFYDSVKNMGRSGILRMPQTGDPANSYDVEFKEPKAGEAYKTFMEFRAALDVAIAVWMLGQNLTTEVGGGSLAATTAHMRVRQDFMDADAETFGACLRDQLIVPWGRFNVSGWDDDQAPWPTWDTGASEDKAANADSLQKTAGAFEIFYNIGLPVDYEALSEQQGIPLREGDTFEPEKPGPVAPVGLPTLGTTAPQKIVDGDKKALARAHRDHAGESKDGFMSGQLYADDLSDDAAAKAATIDDVMGFADRLLALADAAADYDTLRHAIVNEYRNSLPPTKLSELVQRVWMMAHRGGNAAVIEDV